MDKGNILKEIKKLIKFNSETEMINFIDAKTADGVIVRVEGEAFEVGAQLLIVSEDGVIPAGPELAGEHTLEDGVKIVLDETGTITEIIAAEELEEEKVEDGVEEEFEIETPGMEEKVDETAGMTASTLEEKVDEMEKKILEMEGIIKEMYGANKEVAQFSSLVLEKLDTFIVDTPAELEFKSIKTEYKKVIENNKTNKFSGLEGFKNIRMKK